MARFILNTRLVFFSGLITAMVGVIIGIGVAELSGNTYASELYQRLHHKFALVGGVGGFVVGASQESIRQLKRYKDREEAIQSGQAD